MGSKRVGGAKGDLPEGLIFDHQVYSDKFGDHHQITAFCGDGFVGLLSWWHQGHQISSVQVDEEYQRKGVATELLRQAKEITPDLQHATLLSDDGEAWSRHVGYQGRLIESRHGNKDCAPHSGSGEVAHRASWRSDVGADQSRRDHHAERDRGRTASQGLPTRQPRLPARVATGDDLPLVGPLKRAWQSYSVDTKNQIKAAYRALLSGKEKPDPKTGSLKGFFTVPVGGSVTTSDKRILLMRVNGQWVAVFFVTDHDYSRAEDEVGAWIEFLHRGKTSAVAMVWAWSDKVAGASGPLPELGYQIVRDDVLVTVKAYSEYSPKSVLGALVFDFLTGVVLSISVRPECQRRGVASEMWSRAKAYCPRLQPAGSMAFAKMSAEIVDYKTERPLVGSGGLTFEVTKGQWGVRIQALVNGAAAGALRFYKSNGEIDKIAVLPQYQRQGIATALLAKAREIDPRVHHAKDLTPDGKAWSDKVAGAKGNLPKVIYRWARKDLVMAVRESDGVSIGEMTIGVLDADTLYVASVIAQYKRMGIAQGLLEEVHRVHPTKKIAHAGFYDRQGLNWGREMSKRFPDWNVFSPTIWDKKEFHLATSQDQEDASGVNCGTSDVTGGRKRKPVRRDPKTGLEMCHKKVDGFPCKYLMGHTQGCAVDWDAAYPDEEPEDQIDPKKAYTEFKPPLDIIIHSGGDAVPGGWNGYFVAYEKSTGKKTGFLDYNSAPGEPVLIAMVEVDPSYRRRGVATVLLAALRHEFPDSIIVPGYTTETGGKWWHSVQYAASKHTTSGAKVQSASERPAHLEQGDSQPVDRGSLDVVAGVPASVTVQKHGTVVLPTGADTPESVTRITAGANGLLPEGLTFGVMPRGSGPTQRISIGAQSVMAEINGQYVGSLFWNAQTGEVEDIWVNDDYYRLGIATAMWQEAKRRDPKIKHSEIQTEDGKEWSQKVAACTTKILASGVKIEA